MKASESVKVYTLEEYILLEEAGEVCHEFVNGNLYEISGALREHHKLCKKLLRLLEDLLTGTDCEVNMENMKVSIPGGNQFYYPDIFITKELQTNKNKYNMCLN